MTDSKLERHTRLQSLTTWMFAFLFMLAAGVIGAARATAAPTAGGDANPEQLIRKTTDDIIAQLKTNKDAYAKDLKKLYAMVDQQALPLFDFERMSQWVLGRHWRQATDDQKQRFVKEFRDLLVRTYATALLNYTDQKVAILPSPGKSNPDEAVVRTEIQQGGGAPTVPIYYSFYKGDAGWKVYDVNIDGVSLVSNYRGIYGSKLKTQNMDQLIESMAASNKKPGAPAAKAGSKAS